MRIISRFHDFYDPVMKHGVDRQCIYLRETSEVTPGIPPPWRPWSHREFIVGFCGSLFPVMMVRAKDMASFRVVYTLEEAMAFTATLSRAVLRNHEFRWCEEDYLRQFFETSVSNASELSLKLGVLFLAHRVPIFVQRVHKAYGYFSPNVHPWVADGEVLVLNPRLQNYEFQRIKDPFTAFQEIHGFMSGVLGSQHMPLEEPVPDAIKAASCGHGDRYSFRKPPGGKRGKPEWR